MHATVIGSVVSDFKLVIDGPALFKPDKKLFKSLSLRMINWNGVVFLDLLLGLLE
jgi:hypothetical protein